MKKAAFRLEGGYLATNQEFAQRAHPRGIQVGRQTPCAALQPQARQTACSTDLWGRTRCGRPAWNARLRKGTSATSSWWTPGGSRSKYSRERLCSGEGISPVTGMARGPAIRATGRRGGGRGSRRSTPGGAPPPARMIKDGQLRTARPVEHRRSESGRETAPRTSSTARTVNVATSPPATRSQERGPVHSADARQKSPIEN